ncbi:c-type cytochrome biogenesis protein CcmI [Sedimenticola selenatireducens]|uniref:c-type cytochrome biogenesis protein CcmI n=1 Tax=Sedimenticola selenatireducens TaxID=191960 RepID=UPI000685A48F|nr:c-type cytochrome biogenesis protein CcmI [Sedimenticola selenatireducens]
MMLFWTITAAMIVAALLLLAPALLRNRHSDSLDRDQQNVVIARERLAELQAERDQDILDQAQFEQAKSELELSLLQDLDQKGDESVSAKTEKSGRLALGIVAVFVPVLTLGLYSYLGTQDMVEPRNPALAEALASGGELPSVEQMIGALVERLKQNPDDAQGWYLLGRTNMALKDFATAATAFEKVQQLVGDEPSVLLAWADALAMSEEGNMLGKPAELIRKAVELVPEDTTALWLAGMVEEQAENYALAISYWERLAPQLQDDPQASMRIATLINQAREKGGMSVPPVTAVAPVPGMEKVAVAGKSVTVRVSLSPELSSQVSPDEALFIYARAMQGPKMPLAAARRQVKELPLKLTLDDTGAMMPAMKISNFEQVVVGARVSRSGGAIAQSGDLRGEVVAVTVGAEPVVDIVIDKVVP